MEIHNFSITTGPSERKLSTKIIRSDKTPLCYLSDIISRRSNQRMVNRFLVRTKFDETRDVMRDIIKSVNTKTDDGYIKAFEMMATLKETMAELRRNFASYSSSRQRTLAKDDKIDVDFILNEELADMQEFLHDAQTLLERKREEETTNLRKGMLNLAATQLSKVISDFQKFSKKVIELKKEVTDRSEAKVRQREQQHYADIEHDVAEHQEELAELIARSEESIPRQVWDLFANVGGYRISDVKVLRKSITESSYDDVQNKELDILFGVNKMLELMESKHKSIAERFGIKPRNRKRPWDTFPREGLLSTLDIIAAQYFGSPLSSRTVAAEKKENTMFCVSFFAIVAKGLKNLENSVKNLYESISPTYGGCICSYDTFLDKIDMVSRLSRKAFTSLKNKERKIVDAFSDMKNFIECKLIEMKSSLLNFDFSALC